MLSAKKKVSSGVGVALVGEILLAAGWLVSGRLRFALVSAVAGCGCGQKYAATGTLFVAANSTDVVGANFVV